MSIDALARAAAADARRKAAQEVVLMTMLEDLHKTRRTRTFGTVVATACVVATAAIVGLAFVRDAQPTPTNPGPASSTGVTQQDEICNDPSITCLGGTSYRVDLPVPVTVSLPENFQGAFARIGAGTLEDYRNDLDQATGVTVFEAATPVKDDASWSKDPSAGKTAHEMATWLLARPFLVNASMTETTVGGRAAWRVSAELKPGAKLPADKTGDGSMVAPTFAGSGDTNAGYDQDLSGDYTLLDVPGAGVTVIWSWTLGPDRGVLDDNQPYIDGLSFG